MLDAFVSEWNVIAAAVWAALFNSLPAVCILTGCVWLLLERVKSWSAATRYAGWCGILAMTIALPVAQLFVSHRAAVEATFERSGQVASLPAVNMPVPDSPVRAGGPATEREPLSAGGVILLIWGLALFTQLARLVLALRHHFILKRSAFAPTDEVAVRWRELLARHGAPRRVEVAISSRITMPAMVGYLRPVVLLPEPLAAQLDGEQLDGILLHELAHVRRWDDWAIAAQRFIEAVFALHPLVHLITSKMELQREIACDDWVLQRQRARVYASSLTAVAESCLRPAHSGLMGLAMERPSQLGERVELLLDNTRSTTTRVSWKWVGSFVSALGLACLMSFQLPEVMAFPVQPTPAKPSPPAPEPVPVPVVDPAPPVPPAPPKDDAACAKALAREQSELSTKERELGRKQAELVRRHMQLAQRQMEQSHLRMQQQIRQQLEPQMRQLRDQLSHMDLGQMANGAARAQIQSAELESRLAYLQALRALSHDGLAGKSQLSQEEMNKIREEQDRYQAQAAELGAQQARAAKEFSDRLNAIINDALAHGSTAPKK